MVYRGRKRRQAGSVRLILAALLAAGGIVCIVLRSFGMRFSGFLCAGVAVLLLLSVLLGRLKEAGPFWRVLRGVFYACILVGLVGFGVLEAQILSAAHSAPERADAVIVLGAGVNGTEPSLALRTRLDAAAEYAAAYPDVPIVLTGGQGYGEEITEAECMRRYLTDHGVDESRLLLESEAASTEENFRLSKAVLAEAGYTPEDMTLAVVSNDFHLYRAELLARREGLRTVGVGAPLPWRHLEINYTIREAFALMKAYLL